MSKRIKLILAVVATMAALSTGALPAFAEEAPCGLGYFLGPASSNPKNRADLPANEPGKFVLKRMEELGGGAEFPKGFVDELAACGA